MDLSHTGDFGTALVVDDYQHWDEEIAVPAALRLLRARNTRLDEAFYDVDVIPEAARPALSGELAREGAILRVSPSAENEIVAFETPGAFVAKGADGVRTLAVAGVGSSALGAAAFARNVADAIGAPVAAVVSGYGLADVMTEALGGHFWFGGLNSLRHLFEGLDPAARPLMASEASSAGADGMRWARISRDTASVIDLLENRALDLDLLVGHSKGNLILSEALYAIDTADPARAEALGRKLGVVTFSAKIGMPETVRRVVDVIGERDWFGLLNSRPDIPADIVVPAAGHSTSRRAPLLNGIDVTATMREAGAARVRSAVGGPVRAQHHGGSAAARRRRARRRRAGRGRDDRCAALIRSRRLAGTFAASARRPPMDGIAYLGLLDDDAIQLDVAALQIAALDHPGNDLASETDLLGAIAERLAEAGGHAHGASARAEALAGVFGGEYGFTGDTGTYDAPANTDMIRVLERRRGLPISLSMLYVAAARRIGWQADVLNTPGHVLIRVGREPGALIADPFDRGRVLGAGLMADGTQPVAMSNRAALVRLLTNEATRADAGGDKPRARTVYARMTTVAPGHASGWWDRARLALELGETADARASLGAMLEVTRDPALRQRVSAAIGALAAAR